MSFKITCYCIWSVCTVLLTSVFPFFFSDFNTEPELMPKTPSQKKNGRRRRVTLGRQAENQIRHRFVSIVPASATDPLANILMLIFILFHVVCFGQIIKGKTQQPP